jgi:O-antigen ligase
MGVVVVPVLFWGVLIAEDRSIRHRRTVALCLASYLLFSSISRSAFLGCAVAVTIACITLRREKLLIKGAFVLIFLGTAIAVVQPKQFDAMVSAFSEDVIYKGKPNEGVLGSRRTPWQQTSDVIKESPWFGSGFGTDMVEGGARQGGSIIRTVEGSTREHGNSYLALLDYVGLLGIIPFAVLLFLVFRLVYRGCYSMWRTRDPHHYAVPLVLICIAGLVHAFFEDWLFAVGYYLNIFFWTSVFILSDFQLRAQQSVAARGAWNQPRASARRLPVSANQ